MPEEPIQNIESDNWGSFHLYFYKKMFGAAMECELLDRKKLTKVLLNESFLLDIGSNEKMIVWVS